MADIRKLLERAAVFIDIEAQAVSRLKELEGERLGAAIDLLLACQGRVIATGMGKAGLIARKAAATFASTGTPAHFVHPGESIHGDLGMIGAQDLVIAFSYQGQTDEVLRMIPYLKHVRVPLIAITANDGSDLAAQADVALTLKIDREACPMNLAPTASTTAMLALADTLALLLLEARGFGPEDYAVFHPGGSLGRRLLLKVSDLMHSGTENPVVGEATPLSEAILVMTRCKMASTSVVNGSGKLSGFFTDGDLRRRLVNGAADLAMPIRELMTPNPKRVAPHMMAVKALEILREHKIIELPVCDDEGRPVGLIHLHDITRAGIA